MSSCRGNTHDWMPDGHCAKCGKSRCAALTEHSDRTGQPCRRSALPNSDLCKTHQGIEEWAKVQRAVANPIGGTK